ncbi:uncharacterized protein LOC143881995 [Tasmannia lanceolata]|uniref:uncharacterized protein LOC143881995 n=1 Tax=Tasmannia lanceolata TaxID=3420 RepID=UPI0040649AB2
MPMEDHLSLSLPTLLFLVLINGELNSFAGFTYISPKAEFRKAVSVEMRSVMQVFPGRVRRLWNKWELRTVVLISLSLQVILILTGNRRKRTTNKFVIAVLWSAYLMADWIATLALGILSNNIGDSTHEPQNDTLLAFWAPFLLLHLGGPDTISAFSLEDNELWLRHLLGLAVQFSVALYVFIRSVPDTRLSAPAVLMFFAGMTKYGERTWALRYASRDHFRESMITPPDPGPNYAKFMEEYASKEQAGLTVYIDMQPEPESSLTELDTKEEKLDEMNVLTAAHGFFHTFKRLIVDVMLTFHDRNDSQSFFVKRTPAQAFRVIEIELGFLYEVLYTKSVVVHSVWGIALRSFSFSLILITLVYFSTVVNKHGYSKTDIIITFVLLGGALFLDTLSIVLMALSSWTVVGLKGCNQEWLSNLVFKVISLFRKPDRRRWSNSMAQYNLINLCLDNQPTFIRRKIETAIRKTQKFFGLEDSTHTPVSDELKQFIFEELKKKSMDHRGFKRFSTSRGEWTLQWQGYEKELGWSIEVEFDESVLLWHIATDLCHDKDKDNILTLESYFKISKELSEYMLYLLVFRPFMLTAGIGQIRFQDTRAEAKKFFQRTTGEKTEACTKLLSVETKVKPILVKGDRSKSVLFNACRLAKELLKLKAINNRWKIICHVWVEMLSYAASQCRGNYHAQRLSVGGELLTHIWFLMAHLGIGDQYRIESGHARAKLIVEK